MSDTIFIRGLTIHAYHGVMRHENERGQRFVIDLELTLDLAKAAHSDHLGDTVSYASVVEEVQKVFTAQTFNLIEAAAGVVAERILATFPAIAQVRITVHKPYAPIPAIFTDVGVTLTRHRRM